jgi:hypothetical protein
MCLFIAKCAVLSRRLLIVMGPAHWLPVVLVPEQRLVAFVWLDVVNYTGGCCTPFLEALSA